MNLPLLILLLGLLYIVLFGGIAFFRREGLSLRFALEAACITGIFSLGVFLTGSNINPVVFLIVIYLLTMRVRILVDLGNMFARQGRLAQAGSLFAFAGRLWPDAASELIRQVNLATLRLQENQLDESIDLFNEVLQQAEQGYLGVKYEAAAHFNLGVAFQRKNQPARATVEFNAVIDTWPTSLYAQRAQLALDQQRSKGGHGDEDQPNDH